MDTHAEITNSSSERQIQFWAALGPAFFFLTLLIATMQKTQGQWLLPVTALAALPICMQWRLKGASMAIGALGIVYLNNFFDLSIDQRLWQGGIVSAFSLAALVTALSHDEMGEVLDELQMESKSRLKTLFNLDQKLNDARTAFEKEKALVKKEYAIHQEEVTALKETLETLNTEKKEWSSEQERLGAQLNDMQKQIEELHSEQALMQETETAMRRSLESKDRELAAQTEKMREYQEKLQDKEIEQASLNDLINSLEKQCESLQDARSEIEEVQQQLREKIEECETLEGLLSIDEKEKDELAETITRLTDEKQAMEEQLQTVAATEEQTVALKAKFEELLREKTEECEMLEGLLSNDEKEELERTVTQLAKEKQDLEERVRVFEETEQQVEALKVQAEESANLFRKKSEEYEALEELLIANTKEKAELAEVIANLTEEKQAIIAQLQAVEEKDEKINALKFESDQMANQLEDLVVSYGKKEQELLAKTEQLSQELKTAEDRVAELEKAKVSTPKQKESAEMRRMKGLYKQLQEQFEEKCTVLDEARRGQFRMQERLLNLQREAEENKRKEQGEFEAILEECLAKAEKERQQMADEYQSEIEHLHEVIATLTADATVLQESVH